MVNLYLEVFHLTLEAYTLNFLISFWQWIRVIIPLVIIGNIGLFLSGHLNLGATVTIIASFANQTFKVQNFFEFSVSELIQYYLLKTCFFHPNHCFTISPSFFLNLGLYLQYLIINLDGKEHS